MKLKKKVRIYLLTVRYDNYLHEQLSFDSPSLFFLLWRRLGEILLAYRRSLMVKPVDCRLVFFLRGESEFGNFTSADCGASGPVLETAVVKSSY